MISTPDLAPKRAARNHGDYVQCNDFPKELLWYEFSQLVLGLALDWPSKFLGLFPSIAAVVLTVVATLLQTEPEKFVLSFFGWLMGAADVPLVSQK